MAEKNKILLSVCFGTVFTFLLVFGSKVYAQNTQDEIANEVLRFHVVADSDSEADQALKIEVRDGVLLAFEEELSSCETKEESMMFIATNINEIEEVAQDIVYENGYMYEVTASLSYEYFPTKTYGSITFPAGYYDTLKITIGSGSGQNWWCVLFPPLCYVDGSSEEEVAEAEEELAEVLPEDEYYLVAETDEVEFKFKIVEMWNSVIEEEEQDYIVAE